MTNRTGNFPKANQRKQKPRRKRVVRDAQATRENILTAAFKVFADSGFEGGRINSISRAARSNDRMIYYYFGSKERLYIEVLEKVYRDMWDAERYLALDVLEPEDALTRLIHFTSEYYLSNPDMIAILNTENLHKGRYVSKSRKLKELSSPALGLVERIYRRGVEKGVFRHDVLPLHLYLTILSMNYFCISNRHTLSAFLDYDLTGKGLAPWREWVKSIVLRSIKKQADFKRVSPA
jgi:AcrR family transcriptional regulator